MGFGLLICWIIVEVYGGRIWVMFVFGGGIVFYFMFVFVDLENLYVD